MLLYDRYIVNIAFLKTSTLRKLINGLMLRTSYYLSILLKKQIIWGKPESLSVEPTNLCNLKCPECPSGNDSLNRPRLFLSESVYKSLIDDGRKYLSYLQLYFQGEPFMHPKISDFIAYAVKRKIFVTTSTNGHFLTPENCKKIVDSGLHQLIISIDGTTQSVFEKYRVGGSLDQVISGIRNLQRAKKESKNKLPHIAIQFVVFKQNEHQIKDIKELARQLNIADLRLKSAQIEDFKNGSDLMPKNEKYNRYSKTSGGNYTLKRKSDFKCFRVWTGSVVSAEGDVLPCCFDKEAKYKYGNLNGSTLLNVWKNPTAKDFKSMVWNNPKQIDICQNCTEGLSKTWF